MMKGGQVDTIYMDLAKAFDRQNIQNAFESMLINLLKSYVTNRKQIVCTGIDFIAAIVCTFYKWFAVPNKIKNLFIRGWCENCSEN